MISIHLYRYPYIDLYVHFNRIFRVSSVLPCLVAFSHTRLMIVDENGFIDWGIGSVGSTLTEMWMSRGYSLVFKNTSIMLTNRNYNRHTFFKYF